MYTLRNIGIIKYTTNLYIMCRIKLHKTSKCLWPVYIDMFAMKWTSFFFDVFINHLPKNHRSVLLKITVDLVYFWDIYDVNLWEKLAITVRLRFIETRLKQSYDLRGYFLNLTRETMNILTIAIFHYLS